MRSVGPGGAHDGPGLRVGSVHEPGAAGSGQHRGGTGSVGELVSPLGQAWFHDQRGGLEVVWSLTYRATQLVPGPVHGWCGAPEGWCEQGEDPVVAGERFDQLADSRDSRSPPGQAEGDVGSE